MPKETEGVVRYETVQLPKFEGAIMFRQVRALDRPDYLLIGLGHASYKVQDAVAAASDIDITRTLTYREWDRDLSPEERCADLPEIETQKEDLAKRIENLPIDLPTEERLEAVKKFIENLIKKDKSARFAFRFGMSTANSLLESFGHDDPDKQIIALYCAYFSVWQGMSAIKSETIFKNPNPFEPILHLIELGVIPSFNSSSPKT